MPGPMMDPYQMMRMKRLFGNQEQQAPPPDAGRSWEALMSEQGPMQQSYLQHLETMPDEADFKPSLGRKLGAALVAGVQGFGGNPNAVKTGTDILNAPFRGATARFNNKAARLKEASGIEEKTYTNRLSGRKLDVDEADKKEDNARLRDEYGRKVDADAAIASNRERTFGETQRHNKATEGHSARTAANAEARTKKYGEFVDKYGKGKGASTPPPSRVTAAERQAVLDVIKQYPEYQEFADSSNLPLAVDKETPGGWFSGPQKNPKRGEYEKFIALVEAKKKNMLGAGPYGDVYPLEEE